MFLIRVATSPNFGKGHFSRCVRIRSVIKSKVIWFIDKGTKDIYFKKSKTMMIVNHKTDKKAQGKDKLKVRVFQLELESLLHREESDDIFFQQKTNRGQIYKDTSGLNKALTTALDIKGLKKTIGRDDLKIKDLRHAKVSVIFNTKDKDKINHLSIVHGTSVKVMSEYYHKYVKIE